MGKLGEFHHLRTPRGKKRASRGACPAEARIKVAFKAISTFRSRRMFWMDGHLTGVENVGENGESMFEAKHEQGK